MAVGAQHTIRLREAEGRWKITFHYYPGSVRKFRQDATLQPMDEEEMRKELEVEFAAAAGMEEPELPPNSRPYHGEYAAWYAMEYTEQPNPAFYHIGDWMGNCANFTSQCVWYGFSDGDGMPDILSGENMAASWFAGAGGGSPAWENVGYFWKFATGENDLGCITYDSVSLARAGDVIQTRVKAAPDPGEEEDEETGFNHSLLVADEETLMLAQNSPSCFVYYSDLVNTEIRIIRPVFIKS